MDGRRQKLDIEEQKPRLFTPDLEELIEANKGNYPNFNVVQGLFTKQHSSEAPLTLKEYCFAYVHRICHLPGYNKGTDLPRLFNTLPGGEFFSPNEYKDWMDFVEPQVSEAFPPVSPSGDDKDLQRFRGTIFSETVCAGVFIDLLISPSAKICSYFLNAEDGTIKTTVRDLGCFAATLDDSTHLHLPRSAVTLLSQVVAQYLHGTDTAAIHKANAHRELINIIGTYSKKEATNFILALQNKIKKIKELKSNNNILIERLKTFEGQLANYTILLARDEKLGVSVLYNIYRIESVITELLQQLASSEGQSSSAVAETKASELNPLSILMLPVFLTADTAYQGQIRAEQTAAEHQHAANLLQQLEQAMAKEYARGQLMRVRKLAQTAFKVRVFYENVLKQIYALPQEDQQTEEQRHLSSQLLPILPHTIEPSTSDAELVNINSNIEKGIRFFRNYSWYLATRARYLQLDKNIYKTEKERFFHRIIKEGLKDGSEGEHKEEEKKQQELSITTFPEKLELREFDKYFTIIMAMDRNERLGKWYLENIEELKQEAAWFFARNRASPILPNFELDLNREIEQLPKYPKNITELKEAHDSLVSLRDYFWRFKKSYDSASFWKKTHGLKSWYVVALLWVFVGELCIFLAAGTDTLSTLANAASFAIGGFRISALISLLAIASSPFVINWSEKKSWYPEKKLAMDVLGGALLVIGVTGVTFALIGPESIIVFSQSAQSFVSPALFWLSGFGLLVVAACIIIFNYIRNNIDFLSSDLADNKRLADNNKSFTSDENLSRLLSERTQSISEANLSGLAFRTPSPLLLQRSRSDESTVNQNITTTHSSNLRSFNSADALAQVNKSNAPQTLSHSLSSFSSTDALIQTNTNTVVA
ncbi:MAG: hypothetical protein M1561_01575 [Gammaproteobacteria bacterium]|nr:hypothetical protein [Gammaproteobacteria bacterium]